MNSFVEKSQPREDAHGFPVDNPNSVKTPESVLPDQELLAAVKRRLGPDLTQADIAREIGSSAAAVNKWINGKPVGDVVDLERRLAEWNLHIDERIDMRRSLVATRVARRVMGICRSIVNTSDFGLLTGRAGIGKTSGLQLFALEFPQAIYIAAAKYRGSGEAIRQALWNRVVVRLSTKENQTRRPEVLVGRLVNSKRPLIIDDAHYLTASGLETIVSLHNDTGCPVILSGNPVILENVLRLPDEDQFTSRIGKNQKVVLIDKADARELAELLLDQYAPAFKRDLSDAAVAVCLKRGHGRKLKKQLRATLDILDGGFDRNDPGIKNLKSEGKTDAQIAFALAHSQLLTMEDGQ